MELARYLGLRPNPLTLPDPARLDPQALGPRLLRPVFDPERTQAARAAVGKSRVSAVVWERLLARDLLPLSWVGDPGRGYLPTRAVLERDPYSHLTEAPHAALALALAAALPTVLTAEALAQETIARLGPWQAASPSEPSLNWRLLDGLSHPTGAFNVWHLLHLALMMEELPWTQEELGDAWSPLREQRTREVRPLARWELERTTEELIGALDPTRPPPILEQCRSFAAVLAPVVAAARRWPDVVAQGRRVHWPTGAVPPVRARWYDVDLAEGRAWADLPEPCTPALQLAALGCGWADLAYTRPRHASLTLPPLEAG